MNEATIIQIFVFVRCLITRLYFQPEGNTSVPNQQQKPPLHVFDLVNYMLP